MLLNKPKDKNFYLAYTIFDIWNGEAMTKTGSFIILQPYVDLIIYKMIDDLGYFFAANYESEANQGKAKELHRTITRTYGKYLSLSAMADCFHRVKFAIKPCDAEMRGFDVNAICRCLAKYSKDYNNIKTELEGIIKQLKRNKETVELKPIPEVQRNFIATHIKKIANKSINKTDELERKKMTEAMERYKKELKTKSA